MRGHQVGGGDFPGRGDNTHAKAEMRNKGLLTGEGRVPRMQMDKPEKETCTSIFYDWQRGGTNDKSQEAR